MKQVLHDGNWVVTVPQMYNSTLWMIYMRTFNKTTIYIRIFDATNQFSSDPVMFEVCLIPLRTIEDLCESKKAMDCVEFTAIDGKSLISLIANNDSHKGFKLVIKSDTHHPLQFFIAKHWFQ